MSEACYCDYSPCEFYHSDNRKARKARRCYECGRGIQRGEQYEHVRGKSEGYVFTADTCARCLKLRAWVLAHVPCFCWGHGALLDEARETIEHYSHHCPGLEFGLGRLLVEIKRAPRLAPANHTTNNAEGLST